MSRIRWSAVDRNSCGWARGLHHPQNRFSAALALRLGGIRSGCCHEFVPLSLNARLASKSGDREEKSPFHPFSIACAGKEIALVDLRLTVDALPLVPSNAAQSRALMEARRQTLAALGHWANLWPARWLSTSVATGIWSTSLARLGSCRRPGGFLPRRWRRIAMIAHRHTQKTGGRILGRQKPSARVGSLGQPLGLRSVGRLIERQQRVGEALTPVRTRCVHDVRRRQSAGPT
ncbi:hypothetical protein RFUL19S_03910 [Rhizobacter fulvus]